MPLNVASRVAAGSRDEDRVLHRCTDRGELIIVADGAGGTGRGAWAAEFVVRHAHAFAGDDFAALLSAIDQRLFHEGDGAETTAVVLRVTESWVRGASVGDSGAWLIDDEILELTSGQARKPLLGSGRARPVAFQFPRRGILVTGTDGLFKYVPRNRILACTRLDDLDAMAEALIDAARLPSGRFQDDIAVVLVR